MRLEFGPLDSCSPVLITASDEHPHASLPHYRLLLPSRSALCPCASRPAGLQGRDERGEDLWVMGLDPWIFAVLCSSLHLMSIPMPPNLITGFYYLQGLLCAPAQRVRQGRKAGIRGVRTCGSWDWTPGFLQFFAYHCI